MLCVFSETLLLRSVNSSFALPIRCWGLWVPLGGPWESLGSPLGSLCPLWEALGSPWALHLSISMEYNWRHELRVLPLLGYLFDFCKCFAKTLMIPLGLLCNLGRP